MKIAVYTDSCRQGLLAPIIQSLAPPGAQQECIFYCNYDEYIENLPRSRCDVTIVALDGAEGMESARAARILLPEVPLIWLSDDNGFGPESYRVGCSYFSAAPITPELIRSALQHCPI